MEKEKFLTVFAVFDDKTQRKLKQLQDAVLDLGLKGTQTMDIPFHISLGTYSVGSEEEIKKKVNEVCKSHFCFNIKLNKVGRFGFKVLFIEPEINEELKSLHSLFDNNALNNGFPWHPHATIYMGEEEEVKRAEECLQKLFKSINAEIIGIQMGEFFPTRMIVKDKLKRRKI